MEVLEIRPNELRDLGPGSSGDTASALDGTAVVIVDADRGHPPQGWTPGAMPLVIVGVGEHVRPEPHAAYDVVLTAGDPMLAALTDQVRRRPIAAAALAVLLRGSEGRSVDDGLAAESAVYSTLQAGPEFASWRADSAHTPPPPDGAPPVLVERVGDDLHVVLNRPDRHNAVTAGLRDALAAALALALTDATVTAILLSGNGPSFCSGGDLGEFGTFADPATAHLVRLTRSPARVAHVVADRLCVSLHGSCMGAGIEIPAFANRIVAAADTSISLPELALGLVPGAGGTVSIPRRIGRHRTAALALSGARIDAPTALAWGLVDEVR